MLLSSLLPLLPVLVSLPSASAFFILGQKILVNTRLDPIVNPGAISGHLHTIAGGSNFAASLSYEDQLASQCTTAGVSVDMSNYWIPQLFYYEPVKKTYQLIPAGSMNAYYLPRPGKSGVVKAFPDGLRMISGSPGRRDFDSSDPNDVAITYVCLDYSGAHSGDPDWDQRNSFFNHNCPQGMRAQVNFPNCWDGVNLDSDDHKSHMAWPSGGVDGGDCPTSHPVHLVSLFYEFIFNVQDFPFNTAGNPTWVWANGDTTGYGLHADFANGWPRLINGTNVLQEAIDQCNINNGVGGNLQDCPPFVPYLDNGKANSCQPENDVVNEDIGYGHPIQNLPGNNPMWAGATTTKPSIPDYQENANLTSTRSTISPGFTEVGCIAEGTSGRALLAKSFTSTNMTRGACVSFCQNNGFPLAAMEFGQECYCDSQMRNGASNTTLLANSKCDRACVGNSYENCGGASTLTLFNNPSLYPKESSLPAGWSATGCKVEATNARTLNGFSVSSSSMTQQTCISTCAGKGFTIAGIEYGGECYCGNSYVNGGGAVAPEAQCNMFCSGDAGRTTICGAGSRLTTFSNAAASPAPSSASATSATSSSSSSKASSVSTASSSTSTAAPVPTATNYLGCFQDAGNLRQLQTKVSAANNMTNKMCNTLCQNAGYAYSGTQYYNECWCGNTYDATRLLDNSNCAAPCKGDATDICGGTYYQIAIYSVPKPVVASSAAAYSSSSSVASVAASSSTAAVSTSSSSTSAKASSSSTSTVASSSTSSSSATVLASSTTSSTVAAPTSSMPANYVGCYQDAASPRLLTLRVAANNTMTNTMCNKLCTSAGYTFSGTQYYNECWCGSDFDPIGSQPKILDSSKCAAPCKGDAKDMCGGTYYQIAIYTTPNNPTTGGNTRQARSQYRRSRQASGRHGRDIYRARRDGSAALE